jgi:hypothetical protein
MSSLLTRYERFLTENTKYVEAIDQAGRIILPFFLREDSVLQSEAGYTVLNVLLWYHNSILVKHEKKSVRLQKGTLSTITNIKKTLGSKTISKSDKSCNS